MVAYIYAFLSMISILIGFYALYGLDYDRESLKFASKYSVFSVAKEAWPFGVAGVLYFVYFQSDIIILEYMMGAEASAMYGVAFVMMYSIYLIPSVIGQKYILSKFHYLSYNNPYLLKKYYYDNILKVIAVGVIASIFMWYFMPYLILYLFGEQYQQAISLALVLLIAVPVRFVSIYAGIVLTTKNHVRNKIKFMGIVAVLNIVVNFLLIPTYQEFGAVMATLMSEFLLMVMYVHYIKKYVFN